MATETALAVIETINALDFFKSGAHTDILARLKTEVREKAKGLDISISKDREEMRSLAAKVSKTKNGLDKAGKELVEDEKKRLKLIDKERGIVWDELQALQDEVRQPLTDWENAEKDRVAKHEANLAELVQAGIYTEQNWQTLPIDAMKDRLAEIMASKIDWEEFLGRAKAAVVVTVGQIKSAIQKRETLESERAELERLRAEQAKRDQQDREERIAREAKEAAEAAARLREEERAREAEAERQRIEAEKHEAEARAKQAEALRVAAEVKAAQEAKEALERAAAAEAKAKKDAEEAAERLKAEQERAAEQAALAAQIAAEQAKEAEERLAAEKDRAAAHAKALAEQAEKDKAAALEAEKKRAADAAKAAEDREKVAAAKAEADRKAAVEAERKRQEDEAQRAKEAAAKREADREHSAKINRAVRDALQALDGSNGMRPSLLGHQAEAVVKAIAQGLIPHTKINY
jgi:hypothetical protein